MAGEPPRRLAEAPTEAPFPPPLPWAQRTFASFSDRNYRLFFAGQGLSMVGSWARSTAQGWLVYDLTGRRDLLGAVSALSLLPMAIFSGVAGSVADRVDKRRLLLWIQVAEMALSAALATLVLSGAVEVDHVVVFAAALGVVSAFEMPCRQAFMVEMVGRDRLRNAVALNSMMFNLALVAGPAVAAAIMATAGIGWVFVFDAVSFLAAVAGFRAMRVTRAPRAAAGGMVEHLLEGVRFVRGHGAVRTLVVLLAVAMVFGWAYGSLLPAYAKDVLGEGQVGYAWLFASSGVGACLGAVWVSGRTGARHGRVVVGSLVGFSASLAAIGLATTLPLAVVARAAAGFCMIAFFSTSNTTIQLAVPDALRGRVMGIWALVFGASLGIGQLVLGFVAQKAGTPATFLAGAAVCLVATAAIAAAGGLSEGRSKG